MVIKDTEIGSVKGVTLIELGEGDVKVAFVKNFDEKYSGVMFANDTKKPIGSSDAPAGGTSDEYDMQALLTFTSIESIEVVERHLAKAKIQLRQILKN